MGYWSIKSNNRGLWINTEQCYQFEPRCWTTPAGGVQVLYLGHNDPYERHITLFWKSRIPLVVGLTYDRPRNYWERCKNSIRRAWWIINGLWHRHICEHCTQSFQRRPYDFRRFFHTARFISNNFITTLVMRLPFISQENLDTHLRILCDFFSYDGCGTLTFFVWMPSAYERLGATT